MTWDATIDHTRGRGVLRASGAIDLAGSVSALLALADDPALDSHWPIVVDLTTARYTPSLADATKLGTLTAHAATLATHRVAFLTGDTPLFGVAGLLAGMASAKGIAARAFKAPDELEAWLAG